MFARTQRQIVNPILLLLSSLLLVPACLRAQTGNYTFTNIDYPGWVGGSYVTGINDSAHVAGNYGSNGSGSNGFFYDGTTYYGISYPEADSTFLWGINNGNTMSGFYLITGITYGITYHNGVFNEIDYPGAILTDPYGINNHGDVAGGYTTNFENGFLYSGGIYSTINYPGAITTQLWGINDSKQVVGSYADSDGSGNSFYYDGDGHFTILDYPGSTDMILTGINNAGVVCGFYTDDNGKQHSFLWTAAHGFVPINYSNLIQVYGINNNAQIAGIYMAPDGMPHGFIGTPSDSYVLTVNVTGTGTVRSTDGHIDCPGACSYPYTQGAEVNLNETPGQGSVFVTWSGACSGNGACMVTMNQSLTVGAVFSGPLQFVAVPPCRVVDTRNANGTFGGPAIQGQSTRSFPIPQGACNIPSSASAYSLNVTVVPSGRLGFLTIWPAGENQPEVSLMNSLDGRIKANAAIVPAGTMGAVSVYVTDTTNVVLDIDGYFAPPTTSTLQFFSLTPCRIVDTRNPNGDLGGPFLEQDQERDFPVLESTCIPAAANAAAYSFNVTAVPHPDGQRLGFLSIWPKGQSRPLVSTLNNVTGTIVANAAIVPAGTGGEVAVYPNNDTDLLIDINGYFAASGTGGLSLYPVAPCRVLDTRGDGGNNPPFQGELTVAVTTSPCTPPSTAQAYVFNATVVPPGRLGFLALWPDGEDRPTVSTLNATDGAITSNMAVVPTTNGSIDAYASALTQLILDISSYFAP